jgi:hypothetical protein
MEELLQKFKIDRKTLTADELETLDKWAKALSGTQLTPRDVEQYIGSMIQSVERELSGHENPPMTFANLVFRGRRERHLKARLHNYVMLRDFLTAPERARSYVEKQLGGFTPK